MVMVEMGTNILKMMSKIALILESSSLLRLEPTTLKNMIQQNQKIITKVLQKKNVFHVNLQSLNFFFDFLQFF